MLVGLTLGGLLILGGVALKWALFPTILRQATYCTYILYRIRHKVSETFFVTLNVVSSLLVKSGSPVRIFYSNIRRLTYYIQLDENDNLYHIHVNYYKNVWY